MAIFRGILSSIIFLYINLYLQIHQISAQEQRVYNICNNKIGNYSQNSKFQKNLNTILSSNTSNNINASGFYNNKAGDGADQVNAIAYCRVDVDIKTCRKCINDAAHHLIVICPNQKEAVVWYDDCMFRYSNKSILGILSSDTLLLLYNIQDASNATSFSQEIHSLAGDLVNQVNKGSFRKFAESNMSDASNPTIYGFMQCTPDITAGDCLSCLNNVVDQLSICCFNKVGASALSPSCSFRYEIYPFLNNLSNQPSSPLLSPPSPPPPPTVSPPSPPPPPTVSPPPGKSSKSKTIIIIVVCVIVALLVSILSVCVFIITKPRWQKTSREQKVKEAEEMDAIDDTDTRQYDFSSIKVATNDFSTVNLLGRGGFGDVYKGVLSNGKEIAVKKLSITSSQGENEFKNEVMLLAKLQHKCLVRLLGFCLEQTERLLIYEFMTNGSLDNILFNEVNRSKLDWRQRYKIINNVAKGLLYLHEDSRLMIIHRDLKASNILLDEKMNAKISDFGTARLFSLDESEANTRKIVGTMGYMSPEYAMHGIFSVKSDVYSYGVLLLEIMSGKKNYYSITEDNAEGLLSYAYKIWREGKVFDLIDPMLTAQTHSLEIMMRCIHIALLCVQENVGSRPTMITVVFMLQSLTMPLPLPSEPGFFDNTMSWLSKIHESTSSSSQSKSKSNNATTHYDPSFDEETDSYLYPR